MARGDKSCHLLKILRWTCPRCQAPHRGQ
jgi:hypothetical protein